MTALLRGLRDGVPDRWSTAYVPEGADYRLAAVPLSRGDKPCSGDGTTSALMLGAALTSGSLMQVLPMPLAGRHDRWL